MYSSLTKSPFMLMDLFLSLMRYLMPFASNILNAGSFGLSNSLSPMYISCKLPSSILKSMKRSVVPDASMRTLSRLFLFSRGLTRTSPLSKRSKSAKLIRLSIVSLMSSDRSKPLIMVFSAAKELAKIYLCK